ncbi:MAG: CYTH domain-containing protein [Lentisphaerae bacterium]|nr:CYTH domain-containing protein [Lentisphaerota bacterium]
MALEIERKFLVLNDLWKKDVISSSRIIQGYLTAAATTVRVRLRDGAAFLTIKGKTSGVSRSEFEYPIPVADAEEMLNTLSLDPPVEKIRYIIPAGNDLVWEVDEYLGVNAPLFTAELELPAEDTHFEKPLWLGREISGDSRYSNRALSRRPYSLWSSDEL